MLPLLSFNWIQMYKDQALWPLQFIMITPLFNLRLLRKTCGIHRLEMSVWLSGCTTS